MFIDFQRKSRLFRKRIPCSQTERLQKKQISPLSPLAKNYQVANRGFKIYKLKIRKTIALQRIAASTISPEFQPKNPLEDSKLGSKSD